MCIMGIMHAELCTVEDQDGAVDGGEVGWAGDVWGEEDRGSDVFDCECGEWGAAEGGQGKIDEGGSEGGEGHGRGLREGERLYVLGCEGGDGDVVLGCEGSRGGRGGWSWGWSWFVAATGGAAAWFGFGFECEFLLGGEGFAGMGELV